MNPTRAIRSTDTGDTDHADVRWDCGWCKRFVSGNPKGTVRHVTCDECRDVAT